MRAVSPGASRDRVMTGQWPAHDAARGTEAATETVREFLRWVHSTEGVEGRIRVDGRPVDLLGGAALDRLLARWVGVDKADLDVEAELMADEAALLADLTAEQTRGTAIDLFEVVEEAIRAEWKARRYQSPSKRIG